MMNSEQEFELALHHIEEMTKLVEGNEYEHFFVSHLFPIKFELQRQLTNLLHHSKLTK